MSKSNPQHQISGIYEDFWEEKDREYVLQEKYSSRVQNAHLNESVNESSSRALNLLDYHLSMESEL